MVWVVRTRGPGGEVEVCLLDTKNYKTSIPKEVAQQTVFEGYRTLSDTVCSEMLRKLLLLGFLLCLDILLHELSFTLLQAWLCLFLEGSHGHMLQGGGKSL